MSAFPFDEEKTVYATVTARHTSGYGHLELHIRLPELARTYRASAVTLTLTNQCSKRDYDPGPEPFYAIRLTARDMAEGLEVENLERTAKVVARIKRALDKLDASVGAPAVLLEDLMMRYIKVTRCEHVYVQPEPKQRQWGQSIPDWPRYTPNNFDSLRSALAYAKRGLLLATGTISEAA